MKGTIKITVQSAGAVEYASCISVVGLDGDFYPLQRCSWILLMKLSHLMVRLQSWSFGKCGVILRCHYSLVHAQSGSIGQIEICNHFLNLKLFNCVQRNELDY